MGSQPLLPATPAGFVLHDEPQAKRLVVGSGAAAREIAVLERPGRAPGLFWFGGFGANMRGTKAEALDAFAAETGLACLRFDYSGNGQSSGRFEDGTITRWLEEGRAVFDQLATQPQVVVGSSMGGWIALLLATALRGSGRIAGLVLIAPAVDMTQELMWAAMDRRARDLLASAGAVPMPDSGLPITRALIEDGKQHLFGGRLIEVGCPVAILQGIADQEVPYRHAEQLVARLAADDVVLTLVKDGDHRLSRPQDIDLLRGTVARLVAEIDIARAP